MKGKKIAFPLSKWQEEKRFLFCQLRVKSSPQGQDSGAFLNKAVYVEANMFKGRLKNFVFVAFDKDSVVVAQSPITAHGHTVPVEFIIAIERDHQISGGSALGSVTKANLQSKDRTKAKDL